MVKHPSLAFELHQVLYYVVYLFKLSQSTSFLNFSLSFIITKIIRDFKIEMDKHDSIVVNLVFCIFMNQSLFLGLEIIIKS